MDFVDVVEGRHSIRAFQERDVDSDTLEAILRAARRAPSAGNLQAYRVAVARASSVRRLLALAAFDQGFVAQAPVVLVFLSDPAASAVKYGPHGETMFAIQDATIACAYAQLAAANAGLGACWVGAFREDNVRAALGAEETLRPVALLPLGYPAEEPQVTPRRSLPEMVLEVSEEA